MLFMNIARRFGSVYQEEAGAEAGSPVAAAPVEAAQAAPVAAEASVVAEAAAAAEAVPEVHAMDTYIEQYASANPALSYALTVLRDNGISPTDPAFVAAEVDGDFTLLKTILATKGVQGHEAISQILEKVVSDQRAEADAHEAKTTEIVGQILGDQQDAILEWARETASPEEKESFNNMLEAGGVYARAAALLLKDAFGSSGNTIPATSQVTQGQAAASNAGPLGAREYAAAVQELSKQLGGDPRNSAQYATLSARRAAGRRQGI